MAGWQQRSCRNDSSAVASSSAHTLCAHSLLLLSFSTIAVCVSPCCRNVHSELCYYLGASSHIQSNIDFLTADATTKNVLLCAFDCDERKRRLLQTIIEPLAACVTPIEQLRQYADVQAIKKAYRVQPSELQKHPCASTAIVPIAATASSTAAATNATTISASILDTHYDALSHAVIGRIHVKQ